VRDPPAGYADSGAADFGAADFGAADVGAEALMLHAADFGAEALMLHAADFGAADFGGAALWDAAGDEWNGRRSIGSHPHGSNLPSLVIIHSPM
jgi:hypothetical protein